MKDVYEQIEERENEFWEKGYDNLKSSNMVGKIITIIRALWQMTHSIVYCLSLILTELKEINLTLRRTKS